MTNNEIMIKMENDIRLRGLSSQTREEYIGRARFFLNYIGNKSLEDCDEKDIRNFLMYLMPEVQDILIGYIDAYKANHSTHYRQDKVINALTKCRSAHLGGHATLCEDCGNIQVSYNSCRNRHCPKCQTLAKEKWIENQKSNLFNVGYFHIVTKQ